MGLGSISSNVKKAKKAAKKAKKAVSPAKLGAVVSKPIASAADVAKLTLKDPRAGIIKTVGNVAAGAGEIVQTAHQGLADATRGVPGYDALAQLESKNRQTYQLVGNAYLGAASAVAGAVAGDAGKTYVQTLGAIVSGKGREAGEQLADTLTGGDVIHVIEALRPPAPEELYAPEIEPEQPSLWSRFTGWLYG